MDRRSFLKLGLAGTSAGAAALAIRRLNHRGLGNEIISLDDSLNPSRAIGAEAQRKQELMDTGDERLNQLVKAYVNYLEASNEAHLSRGVSRRWKFLVADSRYANFRKIDESVGTKIFGLLSFNEQYDAWRNLLGERNGFVHIGENQVDPLGVPLSNVIFGRIMDENRGMHYTPVNIPEIIYSGISFEPIVLSYSEKDSGCVLEGACYMKNAHLNLAEARVHAGRLKRFYDETLSTEPERGMAFDHRMAKDAYVGLMRLAQQNNTDFKTEFMKMEKERVLALHEPQHFETPNNEEPSFWSEVAGATQPAYQSFSLANFYRPVRITLLDETAQNKIEHSSFNERKEIAKKFQRQSV